MILTPKITLWLLTLLIGCSAGSALAANHWGYIDSSGRTVLPPCYWQTSPFNSGYALVWVWQNQQPPVTAKYLEKSGKITFELHNRPKDIIEGGLIKFEDNDKFGYKNPSGKIILPAKYSYASSFRKGMALVKDPDCAPFLVIDRAGKEIFRTPSSWQYKLNDYQRGLQPTFQSSDGMMHEFKSSQRCTTDYELEGDLPGFENELERGSDKRFGYTGFFCEGLAAAEKINGQWCYINRQKEIVIELPKTCRSAGEFHEGFACVVVAKEDKAKQDATNGGPETLYFQFIDKTGKTTTKKFPYTKDRSTYPMWSSNFVHGLAPATEIRNHRLIYGYINYAGTFVIAPQFLDAKEFSEGLAEVSFESPDFSAMDYRLDGKGLDHFKEVIYLNKPIGMTREQLIKALGEPNEVNKYGSDKYEIYNFSPGNVCGFAVCIGHIQYTNGKVSGYRLACGSGVDAWIRSNPPPPEFKPSYYYE